MIGNKDDINDAVAAAKKAQKAWAQVGARQRGQIIAHCGAVSNTKMRIRQLNLIIQAFKPLED